MTVLNEMHEQGCNCSYCGDGCTRKMRYGLNIPQGWRNFNAWWVIKFWPRRYLRWTWPRSWFLGRNERKP